MKAILNIVCIVITTAVLVSCGRLDYQRSKSGLIYKIIPSNEKDSVAKEGDWLKLHFVQKINDSVVQTSFGRMPAYARIMPGQIVEYSPLEILTKLKKGDSAVVVLLLDSMLKKGVMQQLPPNLSKEDRISYNFKILEVFRDDSLYKLDEARERELDAPKAKKEQEEAMAKMKEEMLAQRQKEEEEMEKSGEADRGIKAMQEYLAGNNISNARMMGKGTFVVVDREGSGEQAGSGKFVKINYVGSLIRNDSIFDKGTLERKLGEGGLISGMEEGLEAFREGGKGTLYIPGFRAYGKSHPRFQPFEPMKFEVELLRVADSASAEPVPTPQR